MYSAHSVQYRCVSSVIDVRSAGSQFSAHQRGESGMHRSGAGAAFALALMSAAVGAGPASARRQSQDVAVPAIAGPVWTPSHLDGTHGIPYTSSGIDLRSHGYTEPDYFVSG